VRFVGLSNYLGSQLMKAFLQCESNGWSPIVSHQPQYSLVCRDIENETLALCMERGCAVLPWSPLGGGVLTGKYVASEPVPVGTRLGDSEAQARRRLSEFNLSVASEVAKVAGELGKTSAQVALNWVLHRPGVTAPIIGARNLDQLEDNLGAEGWSLDADQLSALDAASSRPLPYPQNMYQMLGIRFAQ
jgi:aryl-alcohol dehydrogenase-like predicted oxidoreductase